MSTDKKRKKRAATPALNHRQKKRLQELKRRRNRVLVLLLVVILILVIAGYLLVSKLGSIMRPKADQTTLSVDSKGKIRLEEVIDLSTTYLRIYFSGIIPILLYNYGSAILRAAGDTRSPLIFCAQ